MYLSTPLHYACSSGQVEVVKFLLHEKGCSVNCKTKRGNTPLHEACAVGHLEVAKLLLEHGCAPKRNDDEDEEGDDDDMALVTHSSESEVLLQQQGLKPKDNGTHLQEKDFGPGCEDYDGTTPLHYASFNGHLHVVKYLIQEQHCNSQCRKKDGATPLHEACAGGHLEIVKFYVDKQECVPKANRDSGGWTSLHYACLYGHKDVAEYLIVECNCDSKCLSNNGSTPLHNACISGNTELVRYLVLEKNCSPNSERDNGITPLHEACFFGHLDTVKFLSLEKRCDPECASDDGRTPLHFACSNGHIDIVKYLVEKQKCFLQHRSNDGVTPLQRACVGGHLEVVKYLVTDCECKIKDNLWFQPNTIQIAYDNYHIDVVAYLLTEQKKRAPSFFSKVFRKRMKQIEQEILHHPCFKLFVVGEAGVGKSTLIKALENKLSDSSTLSLDSITGRLRTVTGVEPLTAGIIPTCIESPNLQTGHIMIYDLAGHREYYSSHAALLGSLASSLGTLVLVVVDLRQSVDDMVNTLQYWSSIIANLCKQTNQESTDSEAQPTVVVVGSYADSVPTQDYQKLSSACKQLKGEFFLRKERQIVLNCTKLRSGGLNFIGDIIIQQCKKYQKQVNFDMQVNFVKQMIQKYFYHHVACRFSKIAKVNGAGMNLKLREESLLPADDATLCQHIMTLSNHGRLLFLKNDQDIDNSWVILKVDVLISEVNGTIFAPTYFKEYQDLANSTGVVPFSKIKDIFFKHSPEMIVDFLTHFEFCHKISESEASLISKSTPNMRRSDKYYFFPALVTVERPEESCRSIVEQSHYRSGWCLECVGNDILSPQFLHVLLIRLAFSFALSYESSQAHNNPVLQRVCNVWKSGIHWQNMDGVQAIVEVGNQSRTVVLTIGCREGYELECVKLRSDIIRTVLEVKSQFLDTVDVEEYIIHPKELKIYPLKATKILTKFFVTNLARAVREKKEVLVHKEGRTPQQEDIRTLLHFEPYTCLNLSQELVIKLFDEANTSTKLLDDYLYDFATVAYEHIPLLEKILCCSGHMKAEFNARCKDEHSHPIDPARRCLILLRTWKFVRFGEEATYNDLRKVLDQYSVFCGRNPMQLVSKFRL